MRKNKVLIAFISCLFVLMSCQEEIVHLPNIPTKNEQGLTQILIATPSQNKNQIDFDDTNRRFKETKKNYLLNDLAHTGYIAGKKTLQKAIVLGKTAKTGNLINASPIGLARITSKGSSTDWHIFADSTFKIEDFEDFTLNHYALRNKLQHKLMLLNQAKDARVIWYDQDFLELKISQAL